MTISVFLADDNLLVREGVRALMELSEDLEVVGVAEDYDSLVEGAGTAQPQVIVTDIRMPPDFQREGIEAAKLVRRRHPGTGIVILSQYDDPEYAVSLLSDGAAGYAYLLKDRVAEGDQLVRAIRDVATGGSVLDPKIVEGLTRPVTADGLLSDAEERLLDQVAEGNPIKAIAVSLGTTPADVDARIEALFVKVAEGLSAGDGAALERLRTLQRAIADRKEQGEELSRLLPGGLAEKLRREGRHIGETEELEVTVLMADIRGYSGIAERTDPAALAGQLNRHRAEMNRAIIAHEGTVMQFVGDAVMAVFGAPNPLAGHATRAVEAATAMHAAQAAVNAEWADRGARVVRARHRRVDRPGCGRAARLGRAPRVLGRGRHGEPDPTAPAVGRARRDGAQRSHLRRPRCAARRRRPRPGTRKGPGDPGRRVPLPQEAVMTDRGITRPLRGIVVAGVLGALTGPTALITTDRATTDLATLMVALPALAAAFGVVTWIAARPQPRNRVVWVLAAFVASVGVYSVGRAVIAATAPEVSLPLDVETQIPADLPSTVAWIEGWTTAVVSARILQPPHVRIAAVSGPGRLPSRR